MKRLFTFLLFFIGGSGLLFIATLSGCNRTTYLVAYKDVHLSPLTVDSNGWPAAAQLPEDSFYYPDFSMWIAFENHILNQAATLLSTNKLYALSLPPNTFRSIEKVQDIRIITLEVYSSQFAPGAELSEFCTYFSHYDTDSMKKAEMIYWLNATRSEYSEFNNAGGLYLTLGTPPDQSGYQKFAIEVLTENRVILRDTTEVFFLNP